MLTRDLHTIARNAVARMSTDTPCEWSREEYLAISHHQLWLEHELRDETERRKFAERQLNSLAPGVLSR